MLARRSLSMIALIIAVIASAQARERRPPEQITVDSKPLRLLSKAHHTHLLGTVALYVIALYGDGAVEDAPLASIDVAKALRIEVTYQDNLRRRVSLDWRRELVPRLEPQAMAHLLGSFAALRHGDVVQIEYVPAKGTSIRVNRGVAVSAAHHDLVLAFLDHWLGDRPVSEEIKRTLLAYSR